MLTMTATDEVVAPARAAQKTWFKRWHRVLVKLLMGKPAGRICYRLSWKTSITAAETRAGGDDDGFTCLPLHS